MDRLPGMPVPPPPSPPQPFELRGSIETHVELTIDLAGLIRRFPKEYESVSLSGGYQPWERPLVFVQEFLENTGDGPSFAYQNLVTEGWDTFVFEEAGRWSLEQFEALCAVCPEARPI